ncbi:MAG: SRPBCC family protein [Nocardioidaceae bacterium]|nr:SRPBCC family protein [Nocardioidaceae bacterium]
MPSDTYTVQRSVRINAPQKRIYDQIADFHNWTNWSPWENLDPALKRTYSGDESGTGAIYAWSGNRKAGQGRMEITEGTEPSKVQIDLVFERPWKARNDTLFSIKPEGSGSQVTWSMTGKKTLMTKMMGIFKSMDKMIGPDFDRGLAQLRATTEKSAAT